MPLNPISFKFIQILLLQVYKLRTFHWNKQGF